MNTNIENISDTRKKIVVSFDADAVAKTSAEVLDDFVKNAKMSGFRPGKAPKAMVEKLYAKSIAEQVERTLTTKAIESINAQKELDLYAVVDIKKEDKDGGVVLEFTADVYPEVKLPESLATVVELEADEVKDEEIDRAVEFHRSQRAKYNEVDRAIQKGDFVRLSYKGTIDGKPVAEAIPNMPIFADQKSTWEEAGNEDAPGVQGIVQGIIGMSKGETKTISHEFPAEFPIKDLAGKKAEYIVEIFEVREKVLPEMDAEFFKSFEVDSLETFRNKIKESIANEKKSNNEILKRQFAVEQLMEKTEIQIPESVKEDERHAILEDMMVRLMSSGASRDDIEKHRDELFENAGKDAEARAKMRVFLHVVAKANDLKVTNEDMSRMLWQESMRTQTKPDDLIKQLRKDPARGNRMRSDALLQKAINFIAEKAEIKVKA